MKPYIIKTRNDLIVDIYEFRRDYILSNSKDVVAMDILLRNILINGEWSGIKNYSDEILWDEWWKLNYEMYVESYAGEFKGIKFTDKLYTDF